MIVATTGHVDHGKSSLIEALTDQRADRLPQERARGMTIEPGFLHATLDGRSIDVVDLPGHERYMRHMLAGVMGADTVLLVVAADDGPMPQTLEHLQVLQGLGVARVVPVITKIDRVDPSRRQAVVHQVRHLLRAHGLPAEPAVEVCAPQRLGIDGLRARLAAGPSDLRPEPAGDPAVETARFRLAVDRVFLRAGLGTVAAGTVLSGRVQAGDALRSPTSGATWRVRAVQRHGQAATHADAGMRCGLNLVPWGAAPPVPLERGDWLVAPDLAHASRRLDVMLVGVGPEGPPGAVPAGVVQLHLGSAVRGARLVMLDPDHGHAQLLLDRPVNAFRGDRFIVRDAAARRVLAGGRVLDASAPQRRRSQPQRLAMLRALSAPTADAALVGALAVEPSGIDWRSFALNSLLPASAMPGLAAVAGARAVPVRGGTRLVRPAAWQELRQQLLAVLDSQHAREPAALGLREDAVLAAVMCAQPGVDAPLARAALHALLGDGEVQRDGFVVRRPHHQPRLSAADTAQLDQVSAVLRAHGRRPPPLGELATAMGLDFDDAQARMHHFAALGHLVQVARNRIFLPETVQALVQVARETAAASPDGWFEVIPFRDRSGLGRNLSVQVLEYFDRVHITRFVRERRMLLEQAPLEPGARPPHDAAPH